MQPCCKRLLCIRHTYCSTTSTQQHVCIHDSTRCGPYCVDAASITSTLAQPMLCSPQDCRGRYGSEGRFTKYVNEGEDGVDTLEWIMAQPWCNGKIGMFGGCLSMYPWAPGWCQDGPLTAGGANATVICRYEDYEMFIMCLVICWPAASAPMQQLPACGEAEGSSRHLH
jgi:hypothetical protein